MSISPGRAVYAALVASVLVLAACGGDDDAGGAGATPDVTVSTETTETTETVDSGPPASVPDPADLPPATVAPDLPDELVGEIGPVAVGGDALPPPPPRVDDSEIRLDPAVGTVAPILVGEDFEGEAVRIAAAEDGPTMVVFLAHWCPHCNEEVPRINELRDAGRFPDGLNIVGVSTAVGPGRPNFPPSQWVDDVDWTYPIMAEGVDVENETLIAADAYGVNGFPFVALVHSDGTVAARWSGGREPDEMIELIDTYLGDDLASPEQ